MFSVDEKLALLRARLDAIYYVEWDDPDERDRAYVSQVKAALALRDLTLDDLAAMKIPHDDKTAVTDAGAGERMRLQHSVGNHNKLFAVANRSQMRIDVIALDVDTAQEFAVRHGHVRSAENASVFRYNDSHIEKLIKDGSALGRAVREGVPGVVEKRGNNVVIGDRVFTPLSVV